MHQDFEQRLNAIDAKLLTPLVRQALLEPTAELLDWTSASLAGGRAQPEEGIIGRLLFAGNANVHDQIVPWSIVLKAFAPPQNAVTPEQTLWTYWKREVLAYQSGILNNLAAGLVTPRCFAVVEYPGEQYWVWMEYVVEEHKIWSLEQYRLAAQHLGQFNGAYLLGRPMPNYPWLNVGHFRHWLVLGEPGLQHIRQLAQHPSSWITPAAAEQTLRLYAEQERLLGCLNQLPQCMCHHDAFRRNLMVRRTAQGELQTVAIDWSALGPGAVGEEIAALVGFSLYFLEVAAIDASRLDALVFDGYLEGLRDAGWQGDEALVRLGYTAAASLWMAVSVTGFLLPRIEDDEQIAAWEQESGLAHVLAQYREIHRFGLALGDEALSLLRR